MATIQEISPAPWRMRLLPASYANVVFHVEHQGRSGGRRVVLHEYPKRNTPYAEDMGRAATRYQMTGYLIGPSYHTVKKDLIEALESSEGAPLMDPYLATAKICICERYSVTETRERGGYCTFEMSFVEVGIPGNFPEQVNSKQQLQNGAQTLAQTAAQTANDQATMPEADPQAVLPQP
jgi:prophage DNA circulation protein